MQAGEQPLDLFDRKRLPRRRCPRYAEFVERLQPVSLTLIFSSYYLNNPASAFGHTFLRVNKAGAADREGRELLDYGIDFSAIVDTGNAVLYAIKGLTGLFPGKFNKVPYYYKVQEYNDYESRDLWEYELSMTPDQVRFVVAHLWELGSTYFAYYYLSENCSYHILGALEVGNPELELLRHVGWPVVPADTVKALLTIPGSCGASTTARRTARAFARASRRSRRKSSSSRWRAPARAAA